MKVSTVSLSLLALSTIVIGGASAVPAIAISVVFYQAQKGLYIGQLYNPHNVVTAVQTSRMTSDDPDVLTGLLTFSSRIVSGFIASYDWPASDESGDAKVSGMQVTADDGTVVEGFYSYKGYLAHCSFNNRVESAMVFETTDSFAKGPARVRTTKGLTFLESGVQSICASSDPEAALKQYVNSGSPVPASSSAF